ncbi:MAG: metallophosphoesterase, partial [Chloroflexi bacterium]|nr:metallophosphoesterase [Chloroflexota bacterium]
MTRLAILSDIHGNLTALEAVLRDLASFEVDQIVVAGDVVNWGPHNVEVMERVVSAGWPVIRGNNELYLLDQDTERAPAQWNRYTIARWTRRQLGRRWLNVIAAWPDTLSLRFPDACTLRVVHGSPRSHFEGIYSGATDDQIGEMLQGIE